MTERPLNLEILDGVQIQPPRAEQIPNDQGVLVDAHIQLRKSHRERTKQQCNHDRPPAFLVRDTDDGEPNGGYRRQPGKSCPNHQSRDMRHASRMPRELPDDL